MACSTVDDNDRQMLLDQSVDPTCVYTDPLVQCHELDELNVMYRSYQREYAGTSFRTTRFVEPNGRALADWDLIDGEGNAVVSGNS